MTFDRKETFLADSTGAIDAPIIDRGWQRSLPFLSIIIRWSGFQLI
jgi:hypothetical protein